MSRHPAYPSTSTAAAGAGSAASATAAVTAVSAASAVTAASAASSELEVYRNIDPTKHTALFTAFIIANTEEEGVDLLTRAIEAGADVNASIFNTKNLIKAFDNIISTFRESVKGKSDEITAAKKDFHAAGGRLKAHAESLAGKVPTSEQIELLSSLQSELQAKHTIVTRMLDNFKTLQETATPLLASYEPTLQDLHHGYTPVHIAAGSNLIKCLEVLKAHGGDLESPAMVEPTRDAVGVFMRGLSSSLSEELVVKPMTVACNNYSLDSVVWLLSHGAHMRKVDAEVYLRAASKQREKVAHEGAGAEAAAAAGAGSAGASAAAAGGETPSTDIEHKLVVMLASELGGHSIPREYLSNFIQAIDFLVEADPSSITEAPVAALFHAAETLLGDAATGIVDHA